MNTISADMKDFLGNPIAAGCWIVRPYMQGYSPALKFARVIDIKPDKNNVINLHTIGFDYCPYSNNYEIERKQGVSPYIDRIIVISDLYVPQEIRDLFKNSKYNKP